MGKLNEPEEEEEIVDPLVIFSFHLVWLIKKLKFSDQNQGRLHSHKGMSEIRSAHGKM